MEQFYHNDRIISEGIRKGQHLYHILQTNDLNVSKSTAYRHLHKGYLSAAPIDMSRVVKFKPRRQHKLETVPLKAEKSRTYDDFLSHCQVNGLSHWVEMDTVIGTPGEKAILTFDKKTADALGIQEIAAHDVVQSPALLKTLLVSTKQFLKSFSNSSLIAYAFPL